MTGLVIAISFCLITTSVLADAANILGWTRDPSLCTLCGGYYKDNSNILGNKNPASIQDTPLNITSSKAASFKNYGESVINGDVVLIQPGREIKADHVTFFRDKNTNKVTNSFLSGNVKFYEYGRLVVADQSYLDFTKERYTLDNGMYRILSDTKPNSNNGWGTIKHALREPDGVLKMRKATYSPCPPDECDLYLMSEPCDETKISYLLKNSRDIVYIVANEMIYYNNGVLQKRACSTWIGKVTGKRDANNNNIIHLDNKGKSTITANTGYIPPSATSWYLWSDKLTLNRNTGIGKSINTILFFKDIPVFYTPYFRFPIDKRRVTGFLAPTLKSESPGYSLSLPLYLNLAPNYDATFTPSFYNTRGVLLDGEFRHLTAKTSSIIEINYINQDRKFTEFRKEYSSRQFGPEPIPTPAQTSLKDSSANRALFNLNNNINYNTNWKSSLIANYATDDYFLQDFGSPMTSIDQDQLFNQAQIKYTNNNWAFSGKAEGFQTLHRMNRETGKSIAQDLYKKLPQVNLSGYLPNGFGGLDYYLDTEAVNFAKRDDFESRISSLGGGRFNLESGASLPLTWLGGSLIPKISIQATKYALHDRIKTDEPQNITRVLPSLSVDGRLFFDRNTSFLNQTYTQTLEPRLFYLWVPNTNQDDIPIFNTNLPGFDFSQLFRTNRFSGIDRTGDANQISFALTSRILNDAGQEKVNISIGQMLALHKHQVTLTPSDKTNLSPPDPLLREYLSPIAGKIQYLLTPKFNATTEASWDPNYHRFNVATVGLQYKEAGDKVLNLWYNYSLDGDDDLVTKRKRDLSRIGCSAGWRVWSHWNILSSVDYNISYKRSQNYIYGLEYESCCFAVRFVRDRAYIGTNDAYASRTYIQILLKGLGDSKGFGLGSGNSSSSGGIAGYDNQHIMGI